MKRSNNDRAYILLGFRIIGNFGAIIVLPIVFFAWFGKYLDARWGTEPFLVIVGFLLAILLSGFSIYHKAKKYRKEYESLGNQAATKTNEQPQK